MSCLLIWQVVLGHPWGKSPMSNGNIIGWTIFLWLVYLRLITVRLVTEVRNGELAVSLRGLWRTQRVPLHRIESVEVVARNLASEYGGYGVRTTRAGKAYIAADSGGVRLKLAGGGKLAISSRRAAELARALGAQPA